MHPPWDLRFPLYRPASSWLLSVSLSVYAIQKETNILIYRLIIWLDLLHYFDLILQREKRFNLVSQKGIGYCFLKKYIYIVIKMLFISTIDWLIKLYNFIMKSKIICDFVKKLNYFFANCNFYSTIKSVYLFLLVLKKLKTPASLSHLKMSCPCKRKNQQAHWRYTGVYCNAAQFRLTAGQNVYNSVHETPAIEEKKVEYHVRPCSAHAWPRVTRLRGLIHYTTHTNTHTYTVRTKRIDVDCYSSNLNCRQAKYVYICDI